MIYRSGWTLEAAEHRVVDMAIGKGSMMRSAWMMAALVVAGTAMGEDVAIPLVDRLIEANGKIQSMRCDIRREVEVKDRLVSTLSRIWFARPDHLHVETVTPNPRRIVVDGEAIYKWIDGQSEGVRIPLAEAPEAELLQVRRLPASGEEYLLRLKGAPETPLPAEDGFTVRRAYTPAAPHPYTIVALDEEGRLARIELFNPEDHSHRLSRVDFGGWKDIGDFWIATVQLTEARGRDNVALYETLRVSQLKINETIDPTQFEAATWAKGVAFRSQAEMKTLLSEKQKR